MRVFPVLSLIGTITETRRIQFEDNSTDEKIIDISQIRSKETTDTLSNDNVMQRLQPSQVVASDVARKEPKDKVTSLLGSQSEEKPEKNAVYRITCWDATGDARAGCIYQAPTRFAHGQVSHFWLASDSHFIRWIHFYDANVVPTKSNPYNSDYAIAHSEPNFVGVDFVNFIVMFESSDGIQTGVPDDKDWIVYSNPAETYDLAVFSFPSNYEGNNARTYVKSKTGHFNRSDIVLLKFPSAVKNLHFDTIDEMQIDGMIQPGSFAETVTLTNIPPHINEIWFDFDFIDTEKENGIDPVGNWFDATMMTVNVY